MLTDEVIDSLIQFRDKENMWPVVSSKQDWCSYCLKQKTDDEMAYPCYCKRCVIIGINWQKHPPIAKRPQFESNENS